MRVKKEVVLLIFTRTPIPGKVKTRLIPITGEAGAVEIHTELLKQTIETAKRSSIKHIELWCTPTTEHQTLAALAENFSITLKTQAGGDLGERMCFAIEQALRSYNGVLLIGSDCIELSEFDLELALEKLINGCDVVLGPAYDGGYYLIGLTKSYRQLFINIEWGTDRVLEKTRERVAQLKLKSYELARRRDIDRPEDLQSARGQVFDF